MYDVEFNELIGRIYSNSVDSVDLAGECIKNRRAQALAEALKINKSITEISLKFYCYDSEEANVIAKALEVNKSITLISLKVQKSNVRNLSTHSLSCETGGKRAKALAEALKINQLITILSLRGNFIGHEGAIAIAEALKINQSITVLDLKDNFIKRKGAIAIAEALKINQSITILDLKDNFIKRKGAIAIAKVLRHNTSVLELDLTGNKISEEILNSINEMIARNRRIFEARCQAVRKGRLDKLNITDIRILISQLKPKINKNDYYSKEYSKISKTLNNYYSNKFLKINRVVKQTDNTGLPAEIWTKIGSYISPYDIVVTPRDKFESRCQDAREGRFEDLSAPSIKVVMNELEHKVARGDIDSEKHLKQIRALNKHHSENFLALNGVVKQTDNTTLELPAELWTKIGDYVGLYGIINSEKGNRGSYLTNVAWCQDPLILFLNIIATARVLILPSELLLAFTLPFYTAILATYSIMAVTALAVTYRENLPAIISTPVKCVYQAVSGSIDRLINYTTGSNTSTLATR
ncbi:leucine-rich repeat domain-containing protein [Candidatus Jidaibacter acanthamoebae]|nr:hypothetical protein [Candidatus Jidaibacter acanthamoeba]